MKAILIAAGNNVDGSVEVMRRCLTILLRYDGVGDPADRDPSEFEHEFLETWVKENREELCEACLTIVQAWIAGGCAPTIRMAGAATIMLAGGAVRPRRS